jgi:hypothetical protein
MESKPVLLPCPFCGGQSISRFEKQYRIHIQSWHDPNEALYQPFIIGCSICGASIKKMVCNSEFGGADGAKVEARRLSIEAWNKRTPTEVE